MKKTKSTYKKQAIGYYAAKKEQELEKLNKEVTRRKTALMDELFTLITDKTALNDLEATHKKLDALAVKEDALNRVKGSIGTIMMQLAVNNKEAKASK